MKTISLRTEWVSTSAWRGYQQPINAVGGANDTGSSSDSPCPSKKRKEEIAGFKKILRSNGIKHRTTWCRTSNVFCVSQYVCVAPEDKAKAIELAEAYTHETELFYPVSIKL